MGEGDGKRHFVMMNSIELIIFNRRRLLKCAVCVVTVVRGEQESAQGWYDLPSGRERGSRVV